ncbi:hypothetical protein BMF94_1749 [Rhodotorula taiwanensis]|uniref:Uncharacterized protein n=1 Tax=Rhodotorula taiwanensis TaxID=741276 RepID=A0A2S5BEC4_9BASI|nr:hypothetical protein BMF94_1749 [Rhodotorula taiwanensis]
MAVPLTTSAAATDPSPPQAVFPPLLTADVLACQFSSWYPRFKRHAPKATVIRPLPEDEDLVAFLEADGLFLPEGSGPMGISDLSDSDEEEEDSDDEQQPTFSFPRLDAEIRAALAKYDGAVFPKLNWSSPQDAAWMVAGQDMKCQTPADVYLLLKSSDFISHDLDHAFDDCVDYPPPSSGSEIDQASTDLAQLSLTEVAAPTPDTPARPRPRERPYSFELVLKKWFDMPRSQEWRCFVRDNHLLGISQRDTTLYDFLQPQHEQEVICDLIGDFWQGFIRDQAPLRNYVLDVYVTRDRSRVFVIDFNPFSPRTDPLLFSYPELHELFLAASTPSSSFDPPSPAPTSQPARSPALPTIRVVSPTMDPSAGSAVPRYAHNRYPKDVVDMSEGQSIAEFAKEWMSKVGDAAGFGEGAAGKPEQKVEEKEQSSIATLDGERIGR